ncbi:Ycf66 family protein [Roseofilum sp. BLCC_M154]|uniref:Ycf66 family protein n=1 Tax=Roseofilum acuticapitatum BLCC-M154 TaxID=3022444 RepID=A0ABT7AUJ4_9CYAN|nr:Ycf66 family protein [Roseofilum acuticapitatum]MDJ1170581.1 Ycf66 family protein [Roseofilum acuticapitatum BLCC-M154]
MARILALAVGLGSFAFYMAFFFFPEVYRRKSDFIWSGLGFLYALTLWFCAGRFTGAVMLGQMAAVPLLLYLGWETLTLRRQSTPSSEQTPVEVEQLKQNGLGALNRFLKRSPAPEGAVPTAEAPETRTTVEPEEALLETSAPVENESTPGEMPISESESPEPEPESEEVQESVESESETELTEEVEDKEAIAPDAPHESTIESAPEPDEFEESAEPVVTESPIPSPSATAPQPKSKTLSGLLGLFNGIKSRFQKSKPEETPSSDEEIFTPEEPEFSTPTPEPSEPESTEEPVAETPATPEPEIVQEAEINPEDPSEPKNDEIPAPSGSDLPETDSESAETTEEEGVESSIAGEKAEPETDEDTEPESTDAQENKPSRS